MNAQPALLTQFIGVISSCDATESEITFKLSKLPPSQADAFQKWADKLIRNEVKTLVLVYDFDDFSAYHQAAIVPQLKAEREKGEGRS